MYKLLIVDDEPNLVEGLRDGINWQEYDVEVVGVAFNGQEALLLCAELLPDIILTDIKMPKMDGLTFIDRIKGLVPEAKLIIISAFEQFDFARRAILLGVSAYLVKPVRPRVVLAEVEKAVQELQARDRERLRQEQLERSYLESIAYTTESVMNAFISGREVRHDRLEQVLQSSRFCLDFTRCCVMVCLLDAKPYFSFHLQRRYKELLTEQLSAPISFVCFESYRGEMVVLAATTGPGMLAPVLTQSSMELKRSLLHECGLKLYFGVGEESETLWGAVLSYRQARSALDNRLISKRVISPAELAAREAAPMQEADGIPNLFAHYQSALLSGDITGAKRLIAEQLYPLLEGGCYPYCYVRLIYSQLLSLVLGVIMEHKIPMQELTRNSGGLYEQLFGQRTLEGLHLCFLGLQQQLLQRIGSNSGNISRGLIRSAQIYINSRPSGSVSLTEVAAHVALSPSYFSKLFKKETGISFVDYIKNSRIERAKTLLRSTNKKVYEICDELGYQNVQYFTTLFKNMVGMTPLEYKQKEQGGMKE